MTQDGSTAWTAGPSGQWQRGEGQDQSASRCSKSKWTGWEIGAMVAGFVVFWPVGLVALGVKLYNGEMWPGSASGAKPWDLFKTKANETASRWNFAGGFGSGMGSGASSHTGNFAFEDYKKRELERLEAERRKLMEDQKAFAEFVERVRRAKDQDEFDRFMTERRSQPPQS